jgi:hypothetical protein
MILVLVLVFNMVKFGEKLHLYMVVTRGFLSLSEDEQAVIRELAVSHISQKTDFIVFEHGTEFMKHEDEGRTLRVTMPLLTTKVYAKLDDYGSPEELSKEVGHPVNTQYVLTLMLAEEY